jgi:hypothetical protein
MVGAIALITGASAVFVGSLLLRTWLGHGGDSGTSHFRRIQILSHAAVGILGVILMVVHSQPAGSTFPSRMTTNKRQNRPWFSRCSC